MKLRRFKVASIVTLILTLLGCGTTDQTICVSLSYAVFGHGRGVRRASWAYWFAARWIDFCDMESQNIYWGERIDRHQTAVIHESAMIRKGCKIGVGCYVGKNVVLDRGVSSDSWCLFWRKPEIPMTLSEYLGRGRDYPSRLANPLGERDVSGRLDAHGYEQLTIAVEARKQLEEFGLYSSEEFGSWLQKIPDNVVGFIFSGGPHTSANGFKQAFKNASTTLKNVTDQFGYV